MKRTRASDSHIDARPRYRRSIRRTLRTATALATIVASFGFASAKADPLVCLTIYYRVLGGPPQYIANNQCYVPTPWTWLTNGLGCEGVAPIFQVCDESTVSAP